MSSRKNAFSWVIYPFYIILGAKLTQKINCGCQLTYYISKMDVQNYISSNLLRLLLSADGFVSYFIEKQTLSVRNSLNVHHQTHPGLWSAHTFPTFLRPRWKVPACTLDPMPSHLLKDFDPAILSLLIWVVSLYLQDYFHQHVIKCNIFYFRKKQTLHLPPNFLFLKILFTYF